MKNKTYIEAFEEFNNALEELKKQIQLHILKDYYRVLHLFTKNHYFICYNCRHVTKNVYMCFNCDCRSGLMIK